MVLSIDEARYGELLRRELPRKIESDEDYDRWAAEIEEIDMRGNPSNEERALADLLGIALEDYDRRRYPEEFASAPLATLTHLMEENSMSQADLARLLGVTRTTASQICGGKRGISKAVAFKLANRFRLDVRTFLS